MAHLYGWEVVEGVVCVACPDCAFMFAAEHTDDVPEGGYTCPNCENLTASPNPQNSSGQ